MHGVYIHDMECDHEQSVTLSLVIRGNGGFHACICGSTFLRFIGLMFTTVTAGMDAVTLETFSTANGVSFGSYGSL